MNNKGFTLIELIATITLLAILMLIAVPNVIGIVNRNKNKTYVEDAKKLVSLAEYKVRSNSSNKPTSTLSRTFTLEVLGKDEFKSAPNGGSYDPVNSFVKVSLSGNKIVYEVQLLEKKEDGTIKGGIPIISSTDLYSDDATKKVSSSQSSFDMTTGTTPTQILEITPKYFSFGYPTTASTTNYSSLSKPVFATLYSDNVTRGICNLYNGSLNCFRYTGDGVKDAKLLTDAFGESACSDLGSYVECKTPGNANYEYTYKCQLSESRIICWYYGSGCDVTSAGAVDCGD